MDESRRRAVVEFGLISATTVLSVIPPRRRITSNRMFQQQPWDRSRESEREEEGRARERDIDRRIYLNTYWYGCCSKPGTSLAFGFRTGAWGGAREEGGLERRRERREGVVEASLGLSGNLNGVETGLEATQQIHLSPARAISYQEFREGTICLRSKIQRGFAGIWPCFFEL